MTRKAADLGLAHRATILLVEDELLIRMAFAEYLEESGYAVVEAGDASDAIQILSEPNCPVNVVFSDVRMPGPIDGVALAKWILDNKPQTPILLASGDIQSVMSQTHIGREQVIDKPYDFERARAKIRSVLNADRG